MSTKIPLLFLTLVGVIGSFVSADAADSLQQVELNYQKSLRGTVEQMIAEIIKPNPFVISAEKVATILQASGLTLDEFLGKLITIAQPLAHPEISNYQVAVAALAKSGAVYVGVNLEFLGAPLHQTVHAEQFLIANARLHRETELVTMALSAAPCGHCRQFMQEMGGVSSLSLMIRDLPAQKFSDFLPQPFSPQDLGLEGNLMTPQDTGYCFTREYSLYSQAFQAAVNSYAPYSRAKAGLAIQVSDGQIYAGSYLENVGFNPSLSPLQGALVALVADGRDYSEIREVLLVEQPSAAISQEAMSRETLKLIAPQAVFRCEQREF